MAGTTNTSTKLDSALAAATKKNSVEGDRSRDTKPRDSAVPEAGNMPPAPKTLSDTGLSESFVFDLIVKHLYRAGALLGSAIADSIHLPFPLIDHILDELVGKAAAEKRGGRGLGNSADRFALTERGRTYARDLLDHDTYTGAAPVPFNQYSKYVRGQDIERIKITEKMLREAWRDFILDDELFVLIGPAIRSGKSCFLYGPPGTGKTMIANAIAGYLDQHGGGTAVPHAIIVDGSIIRIYDQVYHQPVAKQKKDEGIANLLATPHGDRRWVLCHRPTVIVGGELTLDMLDLRYNTTTRYYEAPLQVKANGGVFVIDDFGRQLVRPKDLLNRWIVPLEEKVDYLTLHTGKKFPVPFEELVVFATNLDPMDLADEAFLRRIRYKIYIGEPSLAAYRAIFQSECKKKGLTYDPAIVDRLLEKYYERGERLRRACDPRDLTDQIYDYCVFNGLPLNITFEMLDQTASEHFADLKEYVKSR